MATLKETRFQVRDVHLRRSKAYSAYLWWSALSSCLGQAETGPFGDQSPNAFLHLQTMCWLDGPALRILRSTLRLSAWLTWSALSMEPAKVTG